MGKITPCEGCRERKKKCSADHPCERCKRLGVQCIYLKPVQPPIIEDYETIQHETLEHHVELLERLVKTMEQDLYSIKPNTLSALPSPTKWQFKFGKNGGVTIDTDILFFSNLLKLGSMFPLVKQPSMDVGNDYLLRRMLSSVLRRGNLNAIIQSINKRQLLPNGVSFISLFKENVPAIVLEKRDLHYQLVDVYFSCLFLNRVIFHKNTFYNLFIKNRHPDTEPSPVIYALCAAVLTSHCKHIMSIVPYDQQMNVSDYYFNRARLAISLQFDEPSLETMITYLHMALYKANTMQPIDANMYLELALRIRFILSDSAYHQIPLYYPTLRAFVNTRTESTILLDNYLGEYEMFNRLVAGFQAAAHFIQFVNNQRGVPLRNAQVVIDNTREINSISRQLYDPIPMPDESQYTTRAIMKEHYIALIAKALCPYFSKVRFGASDMIPLSLLTKTLEKLENVYHQKIPFEYKLNPAIFEDGLHDAEFKNRLAQDSHCDVVSVSIASRYYQSLIAIYEPFLPNIPTSPILMNLSLIQDTEQQQKQQQSIPKDSNMTIHTRKAQEVCYHCAIKVVRLLEYQCTILESCTIPLQSLLCAWDILMRNACLGFSEEDLEKFGITKFLSNKDIQLAQEYAIRCIEVLRRGYMFNGAEHDVWEYYENIENQLLNALYKSASPTAKYWEPVSNW